MDLTEELIAVLEKAKASGEYFNPWILSGVLDGIADGDPDTDKKISVELELWARNMYSR